MKGRVSVALVGCGAWGRFILRDLISLGCTVSVVARSDRSIANARKGGARSVVGAIGKLPDVDGVVVATPTSTHAVVAEEALELGVPVYVEKPLTDDAEAAERLATSAPERLFVMDKWRYHPGIELLGELARTEELGPMVGLRTSRLGWGNPHDVEAVWILAPHDLSIGLEILGEVPRPRAAVADDGTGLLGMLGESPWFALEVSSRSAVRRREVTLVCEDGVAILHDGYDEHIEVVRGVDPRDAATAEPELRRISNEFPLLRELRAFVEHLGGGPPPKSSATEGALIVRAIAELRDLAGLA